MRKTILLLVAIIMISCGEETKPKPKAYLSLEYPELGYNKLNMGKPYYFDVAKSATIPLTIDFSETI